MFKFRGYSSRISPVNSLLKITGALAYNRCLYGSLKFVNFNLNKTDNINQFKQF